VLGLAKRLSPLVAVALLGCGHGLDQNQTAGELGNGAFRYLCVRDGDALCPNGGEASQFPERIATQGLFDVQFSAFHGSDTAFDIIPVASGILEEENGLFRAKAPGTIALLAKRTSDGRVLDFVHLQVLDVSKIRIESNGTTPPLTWQTGVRQTLVPFPLDADGAVLAGGLDYDWTTSDPAVIRLELASPSATMELMPRRPGTATISVTGSGRTDSLSIAVEGEPLASDAGAPDSGVPDAGALDGSTRDGGTAVDGGPAIADGGGKADGAVDGGGP
jgi:hypothetical protein